MDHRAAAATWEESLFTRTKSFISMSDSLAPGSTDILHPYQIINIRHGCSLLRKLTTTIDVSSTPFYYITTKIAFNTVESSGTYVGRSQGWIWEQQHHMHDSSQSQLDPDHFHIHRCLMQHPPASSTSITEGVNFSMSKTMCRAQSRAGVWCKNSTFCPKTVFSAFFFPPTPCTPKSDPTEPGGYIRGEVAFHQGQVLSIGQA